MKRALAVLTAIMICCSIPVAADEKDGFTLIASDNITVTVNGEEVTENRDVTQDDDVVIVAPEEYVLAKIDGKYYPVNEVFSPNEDLDFSKGEMLSLGLGILNGAQVRVGQVNVDENGRLDTTSDSGLRFIGTANYNGTLISDDGVEFGIKISAQGNSVPLYVAAETFQNAEETVFTVALTNIHESNYNRPFTACAYAKAVMYDGTEREMVTQSTTRSVYQVSVGLMKTNEFDGDDTLSYDVNEAVKRVLNAYINQTGIRLTYDKDKNVKRQESGKGSYYGDAFFDVESTVNDDGSTVVVIRPLGEEDEFANSVTIASWWKDYVRVNNNNSEAKGYISEDKIEGNVLSFTFTPPKQVNYSFNQDDSVTVVSEIGENSIKGFKDGKAVEYTLAKDVEVLGLTNDMGDVVPGSVILEGYDEDGKVSAIDVLARVGEKLDGKQFEEDYGVHMPGDGSEDYKNIVTCMFSKSGKNLVCRNLPDTTKVTYTVESNNVKGYRVGIQKTEEGTTVSVKEGKVSAYPSIFESTANYNNYLYLRYNVKTGKVKECVYYCIPRSNDFTGDGEYSDIFSLNE